ncbi:MAG: hypothetical protein KBA31_07390 [Alphaproteobacteria bacterium]|nr:hypothetical protein [Alphaproteobacteria bacterium]
MDVRAFQKQRQRLEAEREALVRAIADVDTKLSELDIAERVAASIPDIDDEVDPPPMQRIGDAARAILRPHVFYGGGKEKPVKEMLLDVLRDAYPSALTAGDLRELALERFGKAINPNTLTVTLVRYRHDKLVTVVNKMWRYVPHPSDQMFFGNDVAADDNSEGDASAATDPEPRGNARGGGP